MRVREAATRLEVSPALIYSLIASGKLRCHKIGNGRGTYRISEEQLAAYLAGAEQHPAPPVPVRHVRLKNLRLP